MKQKHESINVLILAIAASSYLEIGYGNGHNFKKIKCKSKKAIDPNLKHIGENLVDTNSDFFFMDNREKFDVIFIDGDHDCAQVEKDIINAWGALNKGGAIVLHDINPPTKEHQLIPRVQESWTGDAWRSWVGFRNVYGDKIKTEYIPEKYGLGVIYKSGHKVKEGFNEFALEFEDIEADRSIITG